MTVDSKAETAGTYPGRPISRRGFIKLVALGAVGIGGAALGVKRDDIIAEGQRIWQDIKDSSYHPFSEIFDNRENMGSISSKNALSVSSNEAKNLNLQTIDRSKVIIPCPFTPPEGVNIKYFREFRYIPPLPNNIDPGSPEALNWTQKQQDMYKEQGILNQVILSGIPAGTEFLAPADGRIILYEEIIRDQYLAAFRMVIQTINGEAFISGSTSTKLQLLISTPPREPGSDYDLYVGKNGLYVRQGTPLFRFQQPEGTAEIQLSVGSLKIPGKTQGEPYRLDFATKGDKVITLRK